MARLPTAVDLSGQPSLRSGRAYGAADTSAAGRGLASLGNDLVALGGELRKKQDTVDVARAEAYKTEGLLNAQNQFDNDPDYATYKERAPKATGDVVAKAADLIRDPAMRERWKYGAQADAAHVNDRIFDTGTVRSREAETVAFDDALETNRRIYVDPDTSEEAKAKARKDIDGAIATGRSTGLLTPEQADARRKTYIENADFSRGKLAVDRDPSIISRNRGPIAKMISDTAARYGVPPAIALGIAQIESGLNPGAKSPTSSAEGLYQQIDANAAQYGLRNKRNPEENADAGIRFIRDNMNGFRRSLGREPTPGETYLAHFSGFGVAEKIAAADDSTPTSAVFSPNAIAANRSILAGKTVGEVKAWADRKMASAMREAGAGENPEWYKALSPEQRAAIDQEAETRQNQIGAEMRGNIEVATQNAPVAIQNTGAYVGSLPTADQFMQAYGPQDGADRYNKFQAAVQTSQDMYSMRTMSADQIQQMVDTATPTSSGDDAAIQQQRYTALSNAASGIIKARESDPAVYVRQAFPNVDQAWQGVTEDGGYQRAIAVSVAAQQSLGISNVQPLPHDIATNAVAQFKNEQNTQSDRIASVSNVLMATPDKAQRGILFNQLVKAGLPDTTQGAFEALSRGDQGAANRLFQAAMIDPTKIAGAIPGGIKTSDIDLAVQTNIMDQGQVGDLYYGLTNGTADNYVQAERDSKLITNAVNLRLRNGETLDAAIQGVSKDLYGDVQAVTSSNAQIIVPADQDAALILDGLNAKLPEVKTALANSLVVPDSTKTSDGSKAVLDAATTNYVNQVMAEGFFRNSGGGYVFIDPFTGTAVSDMTGRPVIFQPTVAGVRPKRFQQDNNPLTDDTFDKFQKRMGVQ